MTNFDFSTTFTPSRQYRITKRIRQHWNATKFSYASSSRPDHGFLLTCRGRIRFDFAGGQIIAGPGDLVYLPKGIRYEACIPPEFGATEDFLINFDTDICVPLPDRPIKLSEGENREWTELFEKIIQSDRQRGGFYELSLFYLLLDHISTECHPLPPAKTTFLQQAEELLRGNGDFSIREIAGLCGVSESGLRSHFRRVYGASPQEYRMNARIDKAKHLLETTDLSVYEIADRLGFYDEAYFCKMFRKITGCSPKKYAANKTI